MDITEEREIKLRSANDWIREAKKRPIPRAQFGEFWREGELAVLFGDTGMGKSALAMQIAQSLASGISIGPLEMRVEAQPVLYLDMEMNGKQFETRYAADHDGGEARFLHKHHTFHETLLREEFDPMECWIEAGTRPADVFYRELRWLVERSKAKVVIIDSITSLKRSYYGTRETLELMLALKRLQKERDLSILALVQTPKQKDSQPMTANQLSLRVLSTRADSVFGIGQSRTSPAARYLKRVRSVGSTIHFDGMHVPEFRLKKIGGNFLGFEFERFGAEIELISDVCSDKQWETIEKIKALSENGKSIRDIAAEIELPKTTVHRLLQMWRPPAGEAAAEAAAEKRSEPAKNEHYFPGREEFDAALANPKFKEMFATGDDKDRALQQEYGIIERACGRARKDYKESGTFTPLATDPEYVEFLTNGPTQRPDDSIEDARRPENAGGEPEAIDRWAGSQPSPFAGLKHAYDPNGREIYVEKEDARGKPVVWYLPRNDGKFTHKERDTYGPINTTVDGPLCLFSSPTNRQPRD